MMINQYDYHANDKDYPDADDGDYYGHDHDHHVYVDEYLFSIGKTIPIPSKAKMSVPKKRGKENDTNSMIMIIVNLSQPSEACYWWVVEGH